MLEIYISSRVEYRIHKQDSFEDVNHQCELWFSFVVPLFLQALYLGSADIEFSRPLFSALLLLC